MPDSAASAPVVAIVDYGMGNVRSVEKALERVGARPVLTADADAIAAADGVLLPGVGAFGDAMAELRGRELLQVVRQRADEAARGGRPFLGVCLGMQLLVDSSEESPGVEGLGVVPGRCELLRPAPPLKVPHMGWNELAIRGGGGPLLAGLGSAPFVYFVHSFRVVPEGPSDTSAEADYGGAVCAVLGRGNLFGTQFHPEKSQKPGLAMLASFVACVRQSAVGAPDRA